MFDNNNSCRVSIEEREYQNKMADLESRPLDENDIEDAKEFFYDRLTIMSDDYEIYGKLKTLFCDITELKIMNTEKLSLDDAIYRARLLTRFVNALDEWVTEQAKFRVENNLS